MKDVMEWISKVNMEPKNFPHGSNLKTKIKNTSVDKLDAATSDLISEYKKFYNDGFDYLSGSVTFDNFVQSLNLYYDYCQNKSKINFVHQSDFYSSIIPEFLRVTITELLQTNNLLHSIELSTQADITIEMNFDSINGGDLIEKKKRMDLAAYLPKSLTFEAKDRGFIIPIICFEVKTNLDKNMISGVETNSQTLKRTFPRCRYYLIAEYSDFDVKAQNYASTNIDEIIILRQQTRGEKRRLNKMNDISSSLLNELMIDVEGCIKSISSRNNTLSNRMRYGRLSR